MDWASRRVLAWRLSNTMDARFCVEALNEALDTSGRPEIFNTDQGSQFTSFEVTGRLKEAGITISMDGRGRCITGLAVSLASVLLIVLFVRDEFSFDKWIPDHERTYLVGFNQTKAGTVPIWFGMVWYHLSSPA